VSRSEGSYIETQQYSLCFFVEIMVLLILASYYSATVSPTAKATIVWYTNKKT